MQAFARVVEAGSFTKAAQTLNLSKTTVTQLVQQLEARLRVTLLNRTTRRVATTADGVAYYERVVRVLADLDDAETSLSGASKGLRGRLRVDAPSPLARKILVPALPGFHQRYPELQIEMGVSDRLVDMIGANVDCVIRGGAPTEQSLVARHVGDLPLQLCAAPSYLARVGTPLHPQALNTAPHHTVGFLSSRTGSVLSHTVQRSTEQVQVRGHHVLSVDDGNAYLAAGLAGLGVLCLPDYMSKTHFALNELTPLFVDWHLDPMPVYLAFSPNRNMSRKLRVFIDWVVELMAVRAPVAARISS